MRTITTSLLAAVVAAPLVGPTASAQQYADVLGDYSPGANVDNHYPSGLPLANANAALGGPTAQVLLGTYDDGQGNPEAEAHTNIVSLGSYTGGTGLVVGFSNGVANLSGADLLIAGNAFPGSYEPAFVEVAVESAGGGAIANGWQDETFYLIKPGNFAALNKIGNDPRAVAQDIPHDDFDNDGFSEYGAGAFENPPTGFADVTAGGDLIDIADAIDAVGNPVALTDIAYIRLRSVTDDEFNFVFDFEEFGTNPITAEVDYIENLHVPEPTALALIALGGMALIRRR